MGDGKSLGPLPEWEALLATQPALQALACCLNLGIYYIREYMWYEFVCAISLGQDTGSNSFV